MTATSLPAPPGRWTPAALQRLRMILLAASIAVVALVLWLSSGYGLGHDSYVAPDGSFRFEYPGGYRAHRETLSDVGEAMESVNVQGSAAISAFTVVRRAGWGRNIPADRRSEALQGVLNVLLEGRQPQILSQTNLRREYGAGRRIEATADFEGARRTVAVEITLHRDDLYIFSIEGDDPAILQDVEGTLFFDSLKLQ